MRPAPVEFLSEQYSRIEESLNAFGFHLVPSERTGHTASKFCFSRVQSGRDCGDLDEFSDHLEEVPFQELLLMILSLTLPVYYRFFAFLIRPALRDFNIHQTQAVREFIFRGMSDVIELDILSEESGA